jgi:hypothetical protein
MGRNIAERIADAGQALDQMRQDEWTLCIARPICLRLFRHLTACPPVRALPTGPMSFDAVPAPDSLCTTNVNQHRIPETPELIENGVLLGFEWESLQSQENQVFEAWQGCSMAAGAVRLGQGECSNHKECWSVSHACLSCKTSGSEACVVTGSSRLKTRPLQLLFMRPVIPAHLKPGRA